MDLVGASVGAPELRTRRGRSEARRASSVAMRCSSSIRGRQVRRRELRLVGSRRRLHGTNAGGPRTLAGQGHRALARAQGRIRPARRGAPFQLERPRSRGVSGRDVLHPNVFFETSSYGNRALELCLATFGVSQLVFGTDVPVLDPEQGLDAVRGFGDAVADALCHQNPARLLGSRD